jgi:hypothetical protein
MKAWTIPLDVFGNLLDCFIFVWSVFTLSIQSLVSWSVNDCRKAHCVWGCTTHSFELRVGPGGAIDHIACPCRKTFMLTSVCRIEGLPVSNACKLLMQELATYVHVKTSFGIHKGLYLWSWSNFMVCSWVLLRAFLWVGGGAAHVTPREVCEAGDWPPQGSPLLWPSWDREDPIGTCCCQSNRCLLYSCHWEWACPEVCWRRGSYGSWVVPGNKALVTDSTSGGRSDIKRTAWFVQC